MEVVANHPVYDTQPNWNWKTKHSMFLAQCPIFIFVSVLEM
jgi:hypothetical protein